MLLILILILGGVIENDQEQDHDQEQESRILISNELQKHVIGSRADGRRGLH
jgi:hypothetical protein